MTTRAQQGPDKLFLGYTTLYDRCNSLKKEDNLTLFKTGQQQRTQRNVISVPVFRLCTMPRICILYRFMYPFFSFFPRFSCCYASREIRRICRIVFSGFFTVQSGKIIQLQNRSYSSRKCTTILDQVLQLLNMYNKSKKGTTSSSRSAQGR